MPKSHKMMLHTKRNMILININMLEVTGDTNPVRAGRYRKGEKKCNLSDTLIACMTFTSYTPHCCNATCVLTIWSVISILNSVLGMQFEMLSDAPAFTGGILPHTQTLDLTSTGRLLWLISAVLTPDLILLAVLCCRCHTCGLIRVVFFVFFFLIMLACQFWEACQAACSTNAFSLGDKTEMTRQSPFCQHCHGSTGTTVYPKVNGMTECQTGRKVCLFYLKRIDRRHWRHVTHVWIHNNSN